MSEEKEPGNAHCKTAVRVRCARGQHQHRRHALCLWFTPSSEKGKAPTPPLSPPCCAAMTQRPYRANAAGVRPGAVGPMHAALGDRRSPADQNGENPERRAIDTLNSSYIN